MNNSNKASDGLKKLMLDVRTDVSELKQHRGVGKHLIALLNKCISFAPRLATLLNFFKPGTKAGKQADKVLDTIKKEMGEKPTTPKVGK